jgi:hypothetical protein
VEIKVAKVKIRAYGQDYWNRDEKDLVVELMAEYRKRNPNILVNIGNYRKILGRLFEAQPDPVKEKYRAIAKKDLAAQQLRARLNGDAKQKWVFVCLFACVSLPVPFFLAFPFIC